MAKKWYALFSHTGKEIEAIIQQTKIFPTAVLASNKEYNGVLDSDTWEFWRGSGDWINTYLMTKVEDNSIVTLNGYMRIIPERVIDHCRARGIQILNIHPADIERYPELRGKDPQERVFEGLKSGKYGTMGVVIHEVDAGVDTGKIIASTSVFPPVVYTKDTIYNILHDLGTELWVELFEGGLLDG